jgi:hypothetical protein
MRKRVNFHGGFWALLLLLFGLCLTFFPALPVKAATHVIQQVLSKTQFTASSNEILARARTWTSINVGYSQGKPYYPDNQTGYRPDCSGFVTMAWGLSNQPNGGLNTDGLATVSHQISKEELQPGDILLNTQADAHVVIFGGWISNGQLTTTVSDQYDALEENGSEFYGYAVEHTIPYPYYPGYNPQAYVPMRLNAASNPVLPPTPVSPTLQASPVNLIAHNSGFSQPPCHPNESSLECIIVLSSPGSNQGSINWSVSGVVNGGAQCSVFFYTLRSGTLSPGQQVNVPVDFTCDPGVSGTITFTGGASPVIVQWTIVV